MTNPPETKKKKDQETNSLIEDTLSNIRKKFGNESIMRLGEKRVSDIEGISTGSICLDHALGVGGFPVGRIVEIYGPESCGKTTLTLHVISEAQKIGKSCVFIDVENALDPQYAKALGVNIKDLIICQPESGEDAFDIAEELIKSGNIGVIIIDSVAALVPKQELEAEIHDNQMGLQARLMSKGLRKINGSISRTSTLVIFINQLRSKINTGGYGPTETTSGGNALKYYASVRCALKRLSHLKEGEDVIGSRTVINIVKNKVNPPFKNVELDIVFGKGFSKMGELFDLGIELGLIQKSGSWYSFKDIKLGQGKQNVLSFLEKNIEAQDEIRKLILEQYKAD